MVQGGGVRGHGSSGLKGSSRWTEGATFQSGGRQYVPMGGWEYGSGASGLGNLRLSCHLPRRLGAAVLQEEVGLLLATSLREVQVSVWPLVIHVCSLRKKPGPEVLTWALSATKGTKATKGVRSPRVRCTRERAWGAAPGGLNSKISATGD